MITDLIQKVIPQYYSCFHIMPKMCLQWNADEGKFVYISNYYHLKWWYLSILIVALYSGCCIRLVLQKLFSNSYTTSTLMAAILSFQLVYLVFAVVFAYVASTHGSDLAKTINSFMILEKTPIYPIFNADKCRYSSTCTKINRARTRQLQLYPQKVKLPLRQAILEAAAIYVSPGFSTFSLLISIFSVYCNLDPLPFIFNAQDFPQLGHIFTDYALSSCLLRFIFVFAPTVEAIRMMAFITLYAVLFPRLTNSYILKINEAFNFQKEFNHLRSLKEFSLALNLYINSFVTLSTCRHFLRNFASSLLLSGLTGCVLSNYLTLKMHRSIPMPLYFVFPLSSIVSTVVILLSYPQICLLNEISRKTLDNFKSSTYCMSNRFYRRKVKSVLELQWEAGIGGFVSFFAMTRSTKKTFFWAILSFTNTAVLSSPEPKH